MSDAVIAPFSRRQHGLVTHAQAREVLSANELKERLRERRLEPVRRRIYRVAGAPESWHQHLLAACLAAGDGTVASFRSATFLWGLDGFSREMLEITVRGRQRTRLEGVIVHDSRVTGPLHVGARSFIPVTSPARTLCDMTTWLPAWAVAKAVDESLRRKLTTLRVLRAVAEALDGPGRRRSTVMREVLERRQPGYHPGDSSPEVRIADLLEHAGLPRPEQQVRIRLGKRTVRVDLAYSDLMIVIEYDSFEHHSPRSVFDSDRARDRELELRGYLVLRYTSTTPDTLIVAEVEKAISNALARGTHLTRASVS
jgi:hypothetical protein